jgi:hypothetical protein
MVSGERGVEGSGWNRTFLWVVEIGWRVRLGQCRLGSDGKGGGAGERVGEVGVEDWGGFAEFLFLGFRKGVY